MLFVLARASWLVPAIALAALGAIDHFGERLSFQLPARILLPVVLLAMTVGTACAVIVLVRGGVLLRRQARFGLGVNVTVGAMLALAALAGARARDRAELEANRLKQSTSEEMARAGWLGSAQVAGARLFAVEMNHGGLKESVTKSFHQPFTLVLMGVDNRQGVDDLVLDLSQVQVLFPDGQALQPLDRAQVIASAAPNDASAHAHALPYRVPRSTSFDRALAFLPFDADLERASGLVVQVNGAPLVIRGRWLSAEEKRAMRPR